MRGDGVAVGHTVTEAPSTVATEPPNHAGQAGTSAMGIPRCAVRGDDPAFGLPAFIAAAKNKGYEVELTRIELVTSCMPCKRSPN